MSDDHAACGVWREAVYPRSFSTARQSAAADVYLDDPPARKLVEFFEQKGLAALKEEDRNEQWYDDWLTHQAKHRLYATVLSPREFSSLSGEFDLLRYARFLEIFAYFSPAHGYSLQVSFLGLVSILMGSNSALKREAVAALEAGGILAFGVSEKSHGSDLFGNEFAVRLNGAGRMVANGAKYYIGNANAASIIATLARKESQSKDRAASAEKRAPFVMVALRPKDFSGTGNLRKIRTLGVRAGFVGAFDLQNHEISDNDVIAEGRAAWDAVLGTVTLGKFFLGFGSIGICEHAMAEAAAHLRTRILYGTPALEMPHLRLAMAEAYVRLTAMKLYAYRALDYVHAANENDRRYLLFNAVQKAKVSTEGVKVMAQLSECIRAKGFESDTYFEMALRDIQLIPSLEGSTHVNLALAARFIPRYFAAGKASLAEPPSLTLGGIESMENPYLMSARTGAINAITFSYYLNAYRPLMTIPNVRAFARRAKAFRRFARRLTKRPEAAEMDVAIAVGKCLATIAYGQLIAENSTLVAVPRQMVSTMFHLLMNDLSELALTLASSAKLDGISRSLIRRVVGVPKATVEEWDFVHQQLAYSFAIATDGPIDANPGDRGAFAKD